MSVTMKLQTEGELWEKYDELNTEKADIIIANASGSIASFSDGADNQPMRSVVSQIEPVQDLHGYANPWPAGGGKNLFGNGNQTVEGDRLICTLVKPLPEGTYFISAVVTSTDTDSTTCRIAFYNGNDMVGTAIQIGRDTRTSQPFYVSTRCTNIYFYSADTLSHGEGDTATYTDIQIETGNAATDYAPYSNLCPISGWTGMNVSRTGKNLLGAGTLFASDTLYGTDGNPSQNQNFNTYRIKSVANTSLTFMGVPVDGNMDFRALQFNNAMGFDSAIISSNGTANTKQTVTITPSKDGWILVCVRKSVADQMLELGSSATSLEAYRGTTYPITWQTEAGIVYGGNLNVTTGVLTVTHAIEDLGNLTWTYDSQTAGHERFYTGSLSGSAVGAASTDVADMMCTSLKVVSNNDTYAHTYDNSISMGATGNIYAYASFYNGDASAFTNGMDGVKLVYQLATPVTYQLTPTEIRTLVGGTNNLFSDTGDVAVEYPADTKKYVDQNERITDVQINGTSITNNGVANVPIASSSNIGAVKIDGNYGLSIPISDGILKINCAGLARTKAGTNAYEPIVASHQHESAFYGLAKAAGADMKNSSNAVGTYTDNAKDKIQSMLGIDTMFGPHETDGAGASQAYAVGDVFTMNGKLYKATSPIALNATITSGTNCTETSVSANIGNELPSFSSADNGKVLRVVNGALEFVFLPSASGVSF